MKTVNLNNILNIPQELLEELMEALEENVYVTELTLVNTGILDKGPVWTSELGMKEHRTCVLEHVSAHVPATAHAFNTHNQSSTNTPRGKYFREAGFFKNKATYTHATDLKLSAITINYVVQLIQRNLKSLKWELQK